VSALVGGLEAVEAQAAEQLDGVGEATGVLGVEADVARLEGVETGVAAGVGAPVAVVGCAHRGGQAAGGCRQSCCCAGVLVDRSTPASRLVPLAQASNLLL
jgi:hypothetical protein